MLVKLGVVQGEPAPTKDPPVKSSYQLIVPALPVADKLIGPGPQTLPATNETTVGKPPIEAVTLVLAAEVHIPSTAST